MRTETGSDLIFGTLIGTVERNVKWRILVRRKRIIQLYGDSRRFEMESAPVDFTKSEHGSVCLNRIHRGARHHFTATTRRTHAATETAQRDHVGLGTYSNHLNWIPAQDDGLRPI